MTDIHLSEEDRAFIDSKVMAGEYETAEDVVSAALQSLGREDDRVRRLVMEADAQIEAGKYVVFPDADAAADSVIERGMKLLNRRS